MENKGFKRNTRQREVILDEIRRAQDHPTAGELYERVRRRLPRISLGTVYRNLERLASKGVLRRIEFAGVETRFDADLSPHYHVRCVDCGRVDDVLEIRHELIREPVGELGGYRVQGYRLEFQGVCPECRAADGSRTNPMLNEPDPERI